MPVWLDHFRAGRRVHRLMAAMVILLLTAGFAWAGWIAYRDLQQPLFPVHGAVFCDDQPAHGANVVFHPLEPQGERAVRAHGDVAADGSFELRTHWVAAGAPAGRYAVTIRWHPRVVSGEDYEPGPNVLPRQYADPGRTPLYVQLGPGVNELPPWRLPFDDCSNADATHVCVSVRSQPHTSHSPIDSHKEAK